VAINQVEYIPSVGLVVVFKRQTFALVSASDVKEKAIVATSKDTTQFLQVKLNTWPSFSWAPHSRSRFQSLGYFQADATISFEKIALLTQICSRCGGCSVQFSIISKSVIRVYHTSETIGTKNAWE